MDVVSADAKRLGRTLGKSDQDRLENYYTSVRDLELRLAKREAWSQRPKPKVAARKPVDIRNNSDFIGQQRLMNDMIRLALETDSTRFVCYHLGGGGGVVPLDGVAEGYHTLSHHGRDESKLDQLEIVETEIVRAWGDFVEDLQNVKESGQTALQNTSVLMTSNLGNASSHDNRNMPVLLAGGPISAWAAPRLRSEAELSASQSVRQPAAGSRTAGGNVPVVDWNDAWSGHGLEHSGEHRVTPNTAEAYTFMNCESCT